jgi:hypothetical protein
MLPGRLLLDLSTIRWNFPGSKAARRYGTKRSYADEIVPAVVTALRPSADLKGIRLSAI